MRVTGDPSTYIDMVRTAVAQQDAGVPVYQVSTYDALMDRATALQRFQTVLFSIFAAIAVSLSAIGLYAVLSYMVVQRRNELGLRIALGAPRSQVLKLVLRGGAVLSVFGLAGGIAASAMLTRFLVGFLYNTLPLDLPAIAGMTLLLFSISMLATLAPAFRASRLNPIETLRQQ